MDRQCLPMQPFGDDVEGHPEYMVCMYNCIFIYLFIVYIRGLLVYI